MLPVRNTSDKEEALSIIPSTNSEVSRWDFSKWFIAVVLGCGVIFGGSAINFSFNEQPFSQGIDEVSTPDRSVGIVTFLVRDYDEAIDWFISSLGFSLLEDISPPPSSGGGARWVVVSPSLPITDESGKAGVLKTSGAALLLALAESPEQRARVGSQTGDHVGFILSTSDFSSDHAEMISRGVKFLEEPRIEPYGTVAIFQDLYGNTWDLIERPR